MTQPAGKRLVTEAALAEALAAGGGGGAVASVNGKTGSVTLSATDVGAATSADVATASTADRARANHTGTQAASTITGLATVATSGAYNDLSGKPTIPAAATDATTTAKGIVQLAGDLGGTAAAPTVPGLTSKAPYRGSPFAPPPVPVTVVSTCDSGWTQLDATVTHDTTVFDAGTASLKLTAPASNKAQAQLTFAAQDWSQSAFSMRMRFDDRASVSDGYILLSTSGTFTQYFRAQYTVKMSSVANNDWVEITLTREDFDFNSGTANWSTVNGIRIQAYSSTTATPSVWVDQIVRYPTPPKPTISICFDDGFATTASVAKAKMDQYGYRGTAFFIAQRLGANGYMNQTQIDTLAQAGWDISGHGDTNLTTMTLADAEADVLANKQYLVDRGYKGADVYAYPNDGQNFAIRTMVAKYFGAARGLSTFGQTRAYVPRRRFQGYQAGISRSVATIQAWLAAGVANNSWMVLTFHNLPNTTSLNEDYTPTDFAAIIDYIATLGVQVLPVSEALADPDAPYISRAPNGTRYRIDVDNSGALVTTAI